MKQKFFKGLLLFLYIFSCGCATKSINGKTISQQKPQEFFPLTIAVTVVDKRPEYQPGKKYHAFQEDMALIPLVPYYTNVYVGTLTGVGILDFQHYIPLTVAEGLRNSRSILYAGYEDSDALKNQYELILELTLNNAFFSDRHISYGVTLAAIYLWFLGVPEHSVAIKLDISWKLYAQSSNKIFAQGKYFFEDSQLSNSLFYEKTQSSLRKLIYQNITAYFTSQLQKLFKQKPRDYWLALFTRHEQWRIARGEKLIYQPLFQDRPHVATKTPSEKFARNRALIIANAQYRDTTDSWTSLKNPISDATNLKQILKTKYGFSHITYIENANRQQIYQAFRRFIVEAQKNDNILVFFAGHGHYDKETETGYWIPVDVEGTQESTFISNEDIRKRIEQLSKKCKHVLLISDSCFSGNLLKRGKDRGLEIRKREGENRYFKKMYRDKSCQVIASGGNEYVDDDFKNTGHSPFAYFLLQKLRANQNQYLSASEIAVHMEKVVANAAYQTPRSGRLKNSMDALGEFFFIHQKPQPKR